MRGNSSDVTSDPKENSEAESKISNMAAERCSDSTPELTAEPTLDTTDEPKMMGEDANNHKKQKASIEERL